MIELLVVVGIVALLIALLLPALGKARARARLVIGVANLRSQSMVLQQYCADSRGSLPPRLIWDYYDSRGALLNDFLARYQRQPFEQPSDPLAWAIPTGIWRCPEVVDDRDRSTHAGVLHQAPNRWLFNTMLSFDGENFDVLADLPPGWPMDAPPAPWRKLDHVRVPSDIISLIDNINYYFEVHMHRETPQSIGFGRETLGNPQESPFTDVRSSHSRVARRPAAFLDGHADAPPFTKAFWQDRLMQFHPGVDANITVEYDHREVQHLMWFVRPEEWAGAVRNP